MWSRSCLCTVCLSSMTWVSDSFRWVMPWPMCAFMNRRYLLRWLSDPVSAARRCLSFSLRCSSCASSSCFLRSRWSIVSARCGSVPGMSGVFTGKVLAVTFRNRSQSSWFESGFRRRCKAWAVEAISLSTSTVGVSRDPFVVFPSLWFVCCVARVSFSVSDLLRFFPVCARGLVSGGATVVFFFGVLSLVCVLESLRSVLGLLH